MAPTAASPPTALTDEDYKQHPLGKKAFRWLQQQEDFSAKFEFYQGYKNSEEYKMLKVIAAVPRGTWHLWEKAAGI